MDGDEWDDGDDGIAWYEAGYGLGARHREATGPDAPSMIHGAARGAATAAEAVRRCRAEPGTRAAELVAMGWRDGAEGRPPAG